MKKRRLPGAPGTLEFEAAHREAMAETEHNPPQPESAARRQASTFEKAVEEFFASEAFQAYAPGTKTWMRGTLRSIMTQPTGPIEEMGYNEIFALVQEPVHATAGNKRLKALRAVLNHWCERNGGRPNPAYMVRKRKRRSGELHTWTPAEIRQFVAHHGPGTRAHLALMLLLHTACRRSDVVTLGPDNIEGGRLIYMPIKTEREDEPSIVSMRILPELAEAIRAVMNQHRFLMTEQKHPAPFTANGFGNWFAERCDEAGLPHCSAHGLRKAACNRLAAAGCTPHQIMAVTGHKSLSEVERYTKRYERANAADEALERLASREAAMHLLRMPERVQR